MQSEPTMQIPAIHNGQTRRREPLPPLANVTLVLGLLATPLGVIQWVWTADWRWLVTGLMLTLVLIVIASAISGAKRYRGRSQ